VTSGGVRVRRCAVSEHTAVTEMRRTQILDAVVAVVAERGVAEASVAAVIARAGVSRRVFYGCYKGLDDALVAVMDRTLERVGVLASSALEGEESWRDGMRAALAAVLAFFDDQPELARVCLVEALGGGPVVLAQRERVVAAFRALVVARIESEVSRVSPLAGESVMASVMGVIHTRLIAPEPEPLIALLGPLMGTIVTPTVADERIAAEEVRRGNELARSMLAARRARLPENAKARSEVPAALRDPRAYRARMCLCYIAAQARQGVHPSNRAVGEGIGAAHRGQVSALLSMLSGLGLLAKEQGRVGRPNAWSVTAQGELVARALEEQSW
jgi:AcrR family transcriptional regulator